MVEFEMVFRQSWVLIERVDALGQGHDVLSNLGVLQIGRAHV